ncbi:MULTISPECIES: serine O-acetyltransferase EpsC [Burkholderia]|jgi:serine O-acetyltransferase|uniref:serine O-acetyltransferase n=2 Tax=Burkholderia contaminans TaxID=488447 RepID=A0A1E3FMG4_9BURK|nr:MULTISPECIES: serine O-acetyltransferase EpsC [Burkholderia]KKL31990.1 serine acetyltransferase [Burkholderia contaminans LMG 23361]MBA9831899.1 serine acetyltransferase [Burkholderia contaminans]MBA9838724.1 serine acetyltransferase [Burkholderia contaminans]MBA9867859.1 serine acetyltransferase [Burkholderia contaminans]MBA9906131.1 serine acetyltransferase [Burkholderia contaminans]
MSTSPARQWGLEEIVAGLRESREELHRTRHPRGIRELPSRDAICKIVNGLRASMFPTHYGAPDLTDESVDFYVGHTLESTLRILSEQIRRALPFLPEHVDTPFAELDERAFEIAREFGRQLPAVRALLVSDIQAAYAGDPAAQHITEILLCYPGVLAMMHHRLAHALHQLGVPLLARFINEIAHSATGIDIHPGAQIGPSFFIDHGTGVVIGETAIIGERVRVYQAVTLGAKSFPADGEGTLVKGNARHPIVEDDVVIYAGATILGRVTIGRGSVIGGNVWLTHSVPPGTSVAQGKVREGGSADKP